MNIPRPDDTIQGPEAQKSPLSPEERWQKQLQDRNMTRLPSTLSWGERLLPYLFVAMETCWIDAILIGLASLNFFQFRTAFMPLWAPFVLMASMYWLTIHLERRAVEECPAKNEGTILAGSQFVFALLAVVTLFIIWSSIYASSAFFLNPRWLGAFLNDVLLLNGAAFHSAALFALSVYFCWRGIRLARRTIEPADVLGALRIGAAIILAVIVIRAGAFDEPLLLLLIPLFLFLLLIAHALAQAVFMRHTHTAGLQGSVVAQERSLFTIIGGFGLVLIFIALVVGTVASPTFLLQVQRALAPVGILYDLLASWLAYAIVFLMTPLFWLFTLVHLRFQPSVVRNITLPSSTTKLKPPTAPPAAVIAVIPYVKVLLPILLAVLLIMAIVVALRVRRVLLQRHNEDQCESVWSWSLFWTQCMAFLRAMWRRFFPGSGTKRATHLDENQEIAAEPTARTIREIYRAFLQWASSRGYPRKRDETPTEFKTRLEPHMLGAEAALNLVTDTYNTTRYGGIVPDASQVQHVQQLWEELQKSGAYPQGDAVSL